MPAAFPVYLRSKHLTTPAGYREVAHASTSFMEVLVAACETDPQDMRFIARCAGYFIDHQFEVQGIFCADKDLDRVIAWLENKFIEQATYDLKYHKKNCVGCHLVN